jgi:hypothetical protein
MVAGLPGRGGDMANEAYETPTLTEYGTIEEWTQQFVDVSVVVG